MKKLPILISMPHGGELIPDEVSDICILSKADLIQDSDEQTHEIYEDLAFEAQEVIRADVARAIVDMNRDKGDFSKDGVIKTHTCFDVPVYKTQPTESLNQHLLDKYYHPYHAALSAAAKSGVKLGLDCHTMAAVAPPVSPDVGNERPIICISNRNGETCPNEWIEELAKMFKKHFDTVQINRPFAGGYIVRSHCHEMPWIQIEYSRTLDVDVNLKARVVKEVICEWVRKNF